MKQKNKMRLFYFLIFLFFIISCQNKDQQKSICFTNQYANHFSITLNQDSSLILRVINPYQGSLNDTFTYYLSHKRDKSNAIHIPVKKVAIFSTTYIGFLDALNELSSIIAISGTNQIYNTKLIKLISQGHIFEMGYENSINYEKLASSKPDVVFIYSVGKENMPYVEKIKSLGIPIVYIAEFMEDSPLGRAEWIKFFGSFFQKSMIADSIFRTIESQYDSIKQIAQSLQIHPTVFLNIPYQGIWYMPEGNSYMAKLIIDAGGNYLYQKIRGNQILKFDFEKVLADAINADIWLNLGLVKTKKELYENDQRYSLFKAYKNGAIFNQTLRINSMGGNDFWESGVVNPHLILEDLYHIFKNDTNFTFHFYQKLN